MGGKKHNGKRINLQEANALFCDVFAELADSDISTTISLAGSARRHKKICGDIDIVIVPKSTDQFDAWCIEKFGLLKNGKPARTGLIEGVQVEFYVATSENYGSQLQMWTGSKFHNIKLRRLSKSKGFSMSQYGFKHLETKELVTCSTELSVYEFLGTPFVPAQSR